MSIKREILQLKFPPELRVKKVKQTDVLFEAFDSLIIKLHTLEATIDDKFKNSNNDHKVIAETALGLWRIKKRILSSDNVTPNIEFEKIFRHLESTLTILTNSGIEIIDHTGEQFDSGKAIKALAFEPASNINRETVIETIKPSIFFNRKSILMGEVIVGTPIVEIQSKEG